MWDYAIFVAVLGSDLWAYSPPSPSFCVSKANVSVALLSGLEELVFVSCSISRNYFLVLFIYFIIMVSFDTYFR